MVHVREVTNGVDLGYAPPVACLTSTVLSNCSLELLGRSLKQDAMGTLPHPRCGGGRASRHIHRTVAGTISPS